MHSMRFWGAYQRHGERAVLKKGYRGVIHLAVAPTWLEASTLRGLIGRTSLRDHWLARYHAGLVTVIAQQLSGTTPGERGTARALLQLLARAPVVRVALAEAARKQGTTVAAQLAATYARSRRDDGTGIAPPASGDSVATLDFEKPRQLAEAMRVGGASSLRWTREQRVRFLREIGLEEQQLETLNDACSEDLGSEAEM